MFSNPKNKSRKPLIDFNDYRQSVFLAGTGRSGTGNPFFSEGTELTGHEFHYSRLRESSESLETVLEIERGVGLGGGRDGIRARSVVAAYTHLHALGSPSWAGGTVRAERKDTGPASVHRLRLEQSRSSVRRGRSQPAASGCRGPRRPGRTASDSPRLPELML